MNQNYIAIWGAVLSTILAIIKIYEIWISRRRVEITCYFDGREDVGNDVIVRNISDKQMIITYWKLSFCKREGLFWKEYNSEEPLQDACDIFIPPHTSKKFNFSNEQYFSWSFLPMKTQRIFFEIFIAGRNRSIKKIIHK